jgi:hypothetical protein
MLANITENESKLHEAQMKIFESSQYIKLMKKLFINPNAQLPSCQSIVYTKDSFRTMKIENIINLFIFCLF